MKKLPKYTVEYNERKEMWTLKKDKTNRITKLFKTKEKVKKGGILKRAVGKDGGSVKIQKLNGRYQEERTYPRSRDPRKSKG